jgi:hypothetical protein
MLITMADHLHMILASFRNDVLRSLSNLEFQIRDLNNYHDMPPLIPIYTPPVETNSEVNNLKNSIINLQENISNLNNQVKLLSDEKDQRATFLNIQSNEHTRNILVRTPALEAAVAMANDMEPFALDGEESEDKIESESEVESDVENKGQLEEDQGEAEEVKVESEVEVESETEDEGEVDEDAVEVEEFEYKGTTYQRDEDGVVYLEGDEVGQWNGKKIIFKTT